MANKMFYFYEVYLLEKNGLLSTAALPRNFKRLQNLQCEMIFTEPNKQEWKEGRREKKSNRRDGEKKHRGD